MHAGAALYEQTKDVIFYGCAAFLYIVLKLIFVDDIMSMCFIRLL